MANTIQNQMAWNYATANKNAPPASYPNSYPSGNPQMLGYEDIAKLLDTSLAAQASGYEEMQNLQREYLGQAAGYLEPFANNNQWADFQWDMLANYPEYVGSVTDAMDEFLDPQSVLNQAVASQIRTGATSSLNALRQNAAAAGIPASQNAMLNINQAATDRLAQLPAQRRIDAANLAQIGAGITGAGIGAAGTAFQTAFQPSAALASLYGNVNVQAPLLQPTLAALMGSAEALGTYYPSLPGYPARHLNQ